MTGFEHVSYTAFNIMSHNNPEYLGPTPDDRFADISPAYSGSEQLAPVGPDNSPWGLGGAAITWIGSVVLLVSIQTLMVIGYAGFRHVNIFDLPALTMFLTRDSAALFVTVLSVFPAHILTLALIWAVVTRFGKYPFLQTIGWEWGRGFNFWKSAGLAVVLYAVGMLIIYTFGQQKTSLDEMIERSVSARYAIAFLATFTAPIVEEFTYRGVLYPAFERVAGTRFAIVAVLALFTVVHLPQYWGSVGVIVTIGLLSFILTWVRAYSGRVLPCVVIHTVFNGIQSVLIVLSPYIEKMGKPPVPAPQGIASIILSHLSAFFH